mgnify:CR=1 FL=1
MCILHNLFLRSPWMLQCIVVYFSFFCNTVAHFNTLSIFMHQSQLTGLERNARIMENIKRK